MSLSAVARNEKLSLFYGLYIPIIEENGVGCNKKKRFLQPTIELSGKFVPMLKKN